MQRCTVDDAFGGSNIYQNKILSKEKLSLLYPEERVLLGHMLNTQTMTVKLSPRRQDKLIAYLFKEEWVTTQQEASI